MTRLAKAAVKVGVEQTELQTFEIPPPRPDAALLRIDAAGVGGSDPAQYRRGNRIPCIMGHEIVGTIERLGEHVATRWGLKPGDRVALHEYIPCYRCKWCIQGDYRLCEEVDFFIFKDINRFGMTPTEIAPALWGGYGQYLHMPWNSVIHKLPLTMPSRHATLAIPFGNGVQWTCLDGGAGPGKSVLVVGPGQQGLGCVVAAKAWGAGKIILSGLSRDRARLLVGLKLGADLAIDSEQENLSKAVMALTDGKGVDVIVDTTGDDTGSVAESAVALAAKGAYLNLNGLGHNIGIRDIKKWYLTVRAPRGHSWAAVDTALKLIGSGKFDIDAVCTHDFPLAQTHDAIMATAGREIPDAVHVTVDPWR